MYKQINYALVEEKRPSFYSSMKYWGKKPHNIWNEYIKTYTPNNGSFLDPFCGSAMSAFEAINAGKVAYAFDLNPLSSFLIEVMSSEFSLKDFAKCVNKIFNIVKNDKIYKREYEIKCANCRSSATIINYKWNKNKIYEIAIKCDNCKSKYTKAVSYSKSQNSNRIIINYWYPDWKFYKSEAFTKSFVKNIGGTYFSDLWTKRNLYILSKIFDLILKEKNKTIQKQLLFGFIQTLHLSSKMCLPRSKKTKRDFSTSWGRCAYICSDKQMEMNPLALFYNSCLGRGSVKSCLVSAKKYLKRKPIIHDINSKLKPENGTNLYYGILDIKKIDLYLKKGSIDFILTDPPYGNLVRYLDLSSVWLCWLSKIDKKYIPLYKDEITINDDDYPSFQNDLTHALKRLNCILNDNGKLILTFNNKNIKIWSAFLSAIRNSDFKIEKIILQQNKRSGESNVKSKSGTSITDFYIRCVKNKKILTKKILSISEFEKFVVNSAVNSINNRGEATDYNILLAHILTEFSVLNYEIKDKDYKYNIENILKQRIGTVFDWEKGSNKWSLLNKKGLKKRLTDRVIEKVSILNKKGVYDRESILKEVYKSFPNGLTPDPIVINDIINKKRSKR